MLANSTGAEGWPDLSRKLSDVTRQRQRAALLFFRLLNSRGQTLSAAHAKVIANGRGGGMRPSGAHPDHEVTDPSLRLGPTLKAADEKKPTHC